MLFTGRGCESYRLRAVRAADMSGKKSARSLRIESEMQRVISELISRQVKDPRVGMVTITAVQAASDMSTARILFLPFGGKHTPEEVQSGLSNAAGFLRGEVGRRLGLRHAPKLEFFYDSLLESADRLTRIIDEAVRSDGALQAQDDKPR